MSDTILPDLSNALTQAVATAGKSVVTVDGRPRRPASGLVWQNGVVVTAAHIIEREDITVVLPDGTRKQAQLAGADPGTDIAVLRVEGDLPTPNRSKETPAVGTLVLAVARPGEGGNGSAGLAATMGVLSATGGAWRTWSGGRLDALIRPDLTLYPGFSGGPLVAADGTVLGIVTSGLTRGLPIAIPTATLERVITQILQKGHVARGYLGVGLQPVSLPENLRKEAGTDVGLLVVSTEAGGPAENAGLIVGDILVSLAGQPVKEPRDIQSLLDSDSIGTQLQAKVLRGGKPQEITVTVGERGE